MTEQKVNKEQEFICGNRDGRSRKGKKRAYNATYNVCRIGVTEKDLQKERAAGLHPQSQTLETKWLSCPALGQKGNASSAVGAAQFIAACLAPDSGQRLELVRRRSGTDEYVVCRLGVPLARMVQELDADLHPGYRFITVKGEKYIQAKPDATKENNVNEVGRPWPDDTFCPISRLTAC